MRTLKMLSIVCFLALSLSILPQVKFFGVENAAAEETNKKIGVKDIIYALQTISSEKSESPIPGRARLRSSDSCTSLVTELKDLAIEEIEKQIDENLSYVLEWGWWCPRYYLMDAEMVSDNTTTPPTAVPTAGGDESAKEYSETNVQVAGVDEADFVKNDGSYIYILSNGKFRIIDAWPPESAREISAFEIEGTPKRMFVHNGSAFIYSSLDFIGGNPYYTGLYYYPYMDYECTYGYNCDFTGDNRQMKITVLDISDVTKPAPIREFYFSGSYINSRRVGNAVHSVVFFPEPYFEGVSYWPEELKCWYWLDEEEEETKADYTKDEIIAMFTALKEKNRQIIAATDITDWLPSVKEIQYVNGQAQISEGVLGACRDYYVSVQKESRSFLSILSIDVNAKGNLESTTIVGDPGAVYASSDALYVSSRYYEYPGIDWFFAPETGIIEASTIHKFNLNNGENPSSTYDGSGVVKGRVLNQFAMDEYKGYFRLATTTGYAWSRDVSNTLFTLEDTGNELKVAGKVDNIATGEDIRSVRFDRDKGFMVTFKKTDPLFVFDLSDPKYPKITGELKVPGFSTYIHMMDDAHLLTIGYDSEDDDDFGWFQGIILQVFDVSDMSNPSLAHKETIGTRGTTSDAATNHLAFNFFKPSQGTPLLAIPMVICEGSSGGWTYGDTATFSGLMVYEVSPEAGFNYLGGVSHMDSIETTADDVEVEKPYYDYMCSNWWTNPNSVVKRSIFMDDYVFSVTMDQIKINLISELGTDVAVINMK